jgi:Activator of Hsp90 ATPase homolog 1-like protein
MGLATVVTWTLSPAGKGAAVRMEQSGFPTGAGTDQYYNGAQYGWQGFIAKLEQVVAGL